MSRFTKISLFAAILLLAYGYLARILNIYFFWEAKTLAWIFLLLPLLGHLVSVIRLRRMKGRKTIWPKLGAGFLILALIAASMAIFMLNTSDAYFEATEFLKTDPGIKNEVGGIRGFGLITTGTVSTTSINGEESGSAKLNIIVRGTKKYRDITVSLEKTQETGWRVLSIK